MATKVTKKKTLPPKMSLEGEGKKAFKSEMIKAKKTTGSTTEYVESPGVVYIGHIPNGFYEAQMKAYFDQFGNVNKLRISRSKKTGKCKGYAFVQFESDMVAQVVADTMNNYLMFHKLLKCQYMTAERVHPETFKGANRKFKKPDSHIRNRQRNNSIKNDTQLASAFKAQEERISKSKLKLAELGIEYDFPSVPKIEVKSADSNLKVEVKSDAENDDQLTSLASLHEGPSDSDVAEEIPSSKKSKRSRLSVSGAPDPVSSVATPKSEGRRKSTRNIMSNEVASTNPDPVSSVATPKSLGRRKSTGKIMSGKAASMTLDPVTSATTPKSLGRRKSTGPIVSDETMTPKSGKKVQKSNKTPKENVVLKSSPKNSTEDLTSSHSTPAHKRQSLSKLGSAKKRKL